MADTALNLAAWIRHHYPYGILDPLTHLKLQKLGFYCYGAALAYECERSIGQVDFEAWEHGPVNRPVYRHYRGYKNQPIPSDQTEATSYDAGTEALLTDVLRVYGLLDAWHLRQQSHLEQPWIDARASGAHSIPTETIRKHFFSKLRSGHVQTPEYLFDAGSFRLDGIPVRPSSASLHDLASLVGRYIPAAQP
jgi:uncharacterized phage-associated protein